MTQNELNSVQLVVTHCDMLLYNFESSYSPTLVALGVQSMIPVLHNQFAFMHLVATMFLVDKKDKPIGGACFKLLEPLDLAHLLEPIARVLSQPVGASTFGDYVRINRNKLGVHGNLTFESLPRCVQAVTFDETALNQFRAAGEGLEAEVRTLRDELKAVLVKRERDGQ